MNETLTQPEITESKELTHEQRVAKAKDLGRAVMSIFAQLEVASDALIEFEDIPREDRVEAARQGITHYNRIYDELGCDSKEVIEFEKEKNFRLFLLTDEEHREAIALSKKQLDKSIPD